jgi:hypothetical protein
MMGPKSPQFLKAPPSADVVYLVDRFASACLMLYPTGSARVLAGAVATAEIPNRTVMPSSRNRSIYARTCRSGCHASCQLRKRSSRKPAAPPIRLATCTPTAEAFHDRLNTVRSALNAVSSVTAPSKQIPHFCAILPNRRMLLIQVCYRRCCSIARADQRA